MLGMRSMPATVTLPLQKPYILASPDQPLLIVAIAMCRSVKVQSNSPWELQDWMQRQHFQVAPSPMCQTCRGLWFRIYLEGSGLKGRRSSA